MEEATNINGNSLLAFLASTHFMIHVYTMLFPVLILPIQEELGITLVQASLLASVPRLINVVLYIPTGLVADKRPTLVLTASFVSAGLGALLITASRSFAMILLGFALLSFGGTLYHPPSLKLASGFPPNRVSFAMGVHNMGSSLGFAAGPLLLGFMMPLWGWRSSFYVWAPLTLLTAVVSYIYTRSRLERRSGKAGPTPMQGIRALFNRGFLTLAAMSMLVEGTFAILFTFVPAYFTLERGMSYSLASLIAGLGPLTGLVGSFVGGFSGDRFGKYWMAVAVLITEAALLVFFPLSSSLLVLAVLYALYRCLQSAFMPLLNSIIVAHSNPDNISLSFSANFVAVNLFGALATTGTSMLIEANGTGIIFPMAVLATVPTIGLILLLRRLEGAKLGS
jgi:NNP family nitrate/nitrite transporter-like MFS transporter